MAEERTQPERPVVVDTAVNPKLVKLIQDEFKHKTKKTPLISIDVAVQFTFWSNVWV